MPPFQECLVCAAEFWIALVNMRPPQSLAPLRVEHSDQCHDWLSTEVVCNIIGASILILNVQMELLQVGGPFLMATVLQLSLWLYKLKRLVIGVDDCLLPHNVNLLLSASMHNGIHLFIIGGVLLNCSGKYLTMIGHWMPMLGEDCTNSIVRVVCLNFKWLLQVWQCEYRCREKALLQLN